MEFTRKNFKLEVRCPNCNKNLVLFQKIVNGKYLEYVTCPNEYCFNRLSTKWDTPNNLNKNIEKVFGVNPLAKFDNQYFIKDEHVKYWWEEYDRNKECS